MIHSFWVPEFGQKQDAVPGIETTLVITPTRIGEFALICTELCGLGHATMRAPVRVVEQAAFEKYLADEAAGGAADETSGEAVFATAGCGGCHTFAPAGTDAQVGPSLDDRSTAAAGSRSRSSCRESIVDPNAVLAAGYQGGVMPDDLRQVALRGAARRARAVSGRRAEGERSDRRSSHTARGAATRSGRRRAAALKRLTGPGFLRAAWMTPLFLAIGIGIVVFLRWLGRLGSGRPTGT